MDWSEELSIGIEKMDSDYRRLVELVNEANDALDRGAPPEDGLALLDEMAAYASSHFGAEERLMEEFEYPDMEIHQRQHEFFFVKVKAKRKALSEDEGTPWREELLRFLSDWLAAHILGEDRLLGDYLREKGVR